MDQPTLGINHPAACWLSKFCETYPINLICNDELQNQEKMYRIVLSQIFAIFNLQSVLYYDGQVLNVDRGGLMSCFHRKSHLSYCQVTQQTNKGA